MATLGIDAFATVPQFESFYEARLDETAMAASDEAKDAAVKDATLYIDAYLRRHGVEPVAETDPLVYTSDIIPERVRQATIRLARHALDGDLFAPLERGGRIVQEGIGSLSVRYADDAPAGSAYPFLDALLSPLLPGGIQGDSSFRTVKVYRT